MISVERGNLFPIIFSYKKYGLTFQRIGYCCGLTHYELKFLLMLKFAFKDTIYWRCPQCGRLHSLKMSYHASHSYDDKCKEENRLLKEW